MTSPDTLTPEWIEAAAEALYTDQMLDMPDDYQWPWTKQDDKQKAYWRERAEYVLNAVHPLIRKSIEMDIHTGLCTCDADGEKFCQGAAAAAAIVHDGFEL